MAFAEIAGAVVGSVISGGLSFLGGESQNESNQAISREQMDFQERMSSTAYQRSMRDMRKAGLNPILAYKQGGASSPSGAGIPAVNTLEGAASSARQISNQVADIRLKNESAKLAQSQTASAQAMRIKLLNEGQIAQYQSESARVQSQVDILHNLMRKQFLLSKSGRIAFEAGLYGRAINPLVQPYNALRRP